MIKSFIIYSKNCGFENIFCYLHWIPNKRLRSYLWGSKYNTLHFWKIPRCCFLQGTTAIGNPLRVENLGDTQVPYSVYIDYLKGLSETAYA